MGLLLGIDIGTTGAKSVIMDENGHVLASAHKGYEIYNTYPNYVEQNAEDWWNALVETVRRCLGEIDHKEEILALCVSTQGGSLVAVDAEGNPLRMAISWMDKMGKRECDILKKGKEDNYHYRKTGWVLSSGFNLVQMKWMQDHEPEIFNKTHKFISTAEYINYKLAGEYYIDYTNAGITNLLNLDSMQWDADILADLGINEERLGTLVKGGEVVGNLCADAANQLGLSTDVKVVIGGHDQYCAAIGIGAIHNGDVFFSTGTAWVVLAVSDKLVFDNEYYFSPGHHLIQGMHGVMATVPTGGISIEWFRKNFGRLVMLDGKNEMEAFREIDNAVDAKNPGADGVMFYPHFLGATCPNWASENKATFVGLDLSHDRYHMARAVMEGVVFEANWIIEKYRERGIGINRLKMLGGAAKSPIWPQIISDITGLPVIIPRIADVACVGAVMFAGIGAGVYKDAQHAYKTVVKEEREITPDSQRFSTYRKLFELYKKRFFLLKELYELKN